ncbi:hypothetical protein Y1Q_0010601 [Alligator mississippiensis]|uniref:Ig-like domain-containing protein n=1 Tax=Alligator mississippiensis TaxID=8496 RepID=A0A151PGZ9_ALLMI|nr:hypothetical protein Y1Q_0010601 [Alligator mississippiensis]
MEACLILSISALVLCPGAVRGDSIRPEEAQVSAAEGATVSLRCFYTSTYSAGYYLYWYRQHRDGAPQYILYRGTKDLSTYSDTAGFATVRFSSKADANSTVLNITALERADTAVYHCALRYAQRDSHTRD